MQRAYHVKANAHLEFLLEKKGNGRFLVQLRGQHELGK
jgi:hypothetical protein